jgi:thioredoxin 1
LCRIGHSPVTDQLETRRNARVSGNIVHTTDATFESDVLKSDTPVLLDFWLNIDDNRHTPVKYGVRGIPTLILFKNGAPEAQQVGLVGKSKLAALLDQHL